MSRPGSPPTVRPGPAPAAVALLLLVAVVYVPGALQNGFASDDSRFLMLNPHVLAPEGWSGWLSILHDPRTVDPMSPTGIVRPLRTLEFALDHALFGPSGPAFHLHSLLWHGLATVLALLLLRRLTGTALPAAVGAALWALHPMQVESVAWVSSRGDVAMGACVLGALLLELRRDGSPNRLAVALAVGALAMLYKETAVVLPLLVFAVRLVRPREGAVGEIVPALRAALPHVAVAAVYLVYRSAVQVGDTAHATTFVLGGSTAGTFSTMFRSIGAYLVMTVLPVRPQFDWYLLPTTTLLIPSALAWFAVLVALVVLAVRSRARRPLLAAGICFFLFPLIPVSNWPFQLGIPTTERFLYLPLLGLALVVSAAVQRRGVLVPVAIAIVAMAAISAVRTTDWRDDDTLLGAELRDGASPRAEAWFAAKARERAVDLRAEAARTEAPDQAQALRARSQELFEEALARAHRSLDHWHRFEMVSHSTSIVVVNPHVNAANALLYLDRPAEALWHADRAVRSDDGSLPQPFYNRAVAVLELGRPAEAVDAVHHAFERGMPRDEPAMVRTALLAGDRLTTAGAFDAARAAYALARSARPEAASQGLAEVDAAQRAAQAAPPPEDLHVARLASVGLPVSPEMLSAVRSSPLGPLVLAFTAERRRDDREAEQRFREALAADAVPPELAERVASALDRIETGCPAWRDHDAQRNSE